MHSTRPTALIRERKGEEDDCSLLYNMYIAQQPQLNCAVMPSFGDPMIIEAFCIVLVAN